MNRKQDIIRTIEQISGSFSPYNVFSDWIECCALSIQNACQLIQNETWYKRENEFSEIMNRYTPDEQSKMAYMFSLLVETMDYEMTDVLGEIYMESGMGSKQTGQFFTPFHVAEMTARISLQDSITSFDGKMMQLNEPSVGGGALIIAAAKVLKDAGINYHRYLDVIAQDIDWKGVYMTYLQCSLYGINATVVQGNSLQIDLKQAKPHCIMRTPAKMGALL